jgi:hypothetical protein
MHNKWGDGGDQADTDGRALLADLIRQDLTNNEIADTLRLSRTRLAPKLDAVRADLQAAGVNPPPKRGPWGHRRG